MAIDSTDFRVEAGRHVDLATLPTAVKALYTSHKNYKKQLKKHVKKLSALQQLHYASDQWALLLIFQGMDAAGKDGAIRHVMSGVNPQGCQVFSFKHPSATELKHDFLWRTTRDLPERGRIGIFNRSYYEEVLIVRVHPEILRSEGLPDQFADGAGRVRNAVRRRVVARDHPPQPPVDENGNSQGCMDVHIAQILKVNRRGAAQKRIGQIQRSSRERHSRGNDRRRHCIDIRNRPDGIQEKELPHLRRNITGREAHAKIRNGRAANCFGNHLAIPLLIESIDHHAFEAAESPNLACGHLRQLRNVGGRPQA